MRVRWFLRTIVLIVASLALLLFTASEIIVAVPVAWWLYVATLGMFAIGLLEKQHPRRQVRRFGALISICFVAAILNLTPWSSRNGFLKRLYSIKPGMTVTQVKAVMRGYIQGTGIPPNPFADTRIPTEGLTIQSALVFRHSEEPAYNADWGIVNLRDGIVTSVEFSAD
jgi:hypothetical protein